MFKSYRTTSIVHYSSSYFHFFLFLCTVQSNMNHLKPIYFTQRWFPKKCYNLRFESTREYCTLHKSPDSELYHQMHFNVILWTSHFLWGYPTDKDTVRVFYAPQTWQNIFRENTDISKIEQFFDVLNKAELIIRQGVVHGTKLKLTSHKFIPHA